MSVKVFEAIKSRVREKPRRVLLAEVEDERVLRAAKQVVKEGFAKVVFLGEGPKLADAIKKAGGRPEQFEYIAVEEERVKEFANIFFEKRKHRGVSREDAERAVRDPVFYGAMLVQAGAVDGMVSGSASPTPHVVRAAIHCVGPREGTETISSCFVMITPLAEIGQKGVLLFSDCAVVPQPSVNQLVDITLEAAKSWRLFTETEPVIAVLSFSTKSKKPHPLGEKAVAVVREVRKRAPDLVIDGEIQVDAALIPEVAALKCPESAIGGKANVLIFPDLGAGNIGYKLAERCSGGEAVGPILQGLAKPVNDLSRGCHPEDIVNVVAITALQATVLE